MPDELADTPTELPRRCSRLILRWRRSWGLNGGMPSALHAFPIAVGRRPPGLAEKPGVRVAEAVWTFWKR